MWNHHLAKHSWKFDWFNFVEFASFAPPTGGSPKAMISLTLVGLAKDDIDNTGVTELFFRKMGAIPTTKRLIPTVYSFEQKSLFSVHTRCYKTVIRREACTMLPWPKSQLSQCWVVDEQHGGCSGWYAINITSSTGFWPSPVQSTFMSCLGWKHEIPNHQNMVKHHEMILSNDPPLVTIVSSCNG